MADARFIVRDIRLGQDTSLRTIREPYWIVDTTTNLPVDEFASKRAATMTAKEMNANLCQDCGSDNLFSGHFDADDLAHPLNAGDVTPEGVRWTTFCNDCGAEQAPKRRGK